MRLIDCGPCVCLSPLSVINAKARDRNVYVGHLVSPNPLELLGGTAVAAAFRPQRHGTPRPRRWALKECCPPQPAGVSHHSLEPYI